MAASASSAAPTDANASVAAIPTECQENAQAAQLSVSEPTAEAAPSPWPMIGKDTTLVPEIARLKAEQVAMREQKKRLAKELKNAERKRSRLKKRAKLLTDSDLVAVMMLRVAERKDREAGTKSTGTAVVPAEAKKTTEPTAGERGDPIADAEVQQDGEEEG